MGLLNERVALVTGASRGIGKAIALELARQGAVIVVNYVELDPGATESKNLQEANETVAAIQAEGSDAIVVQGDVTKMEEIEAVVQAAVDKYGKLDILVNNAGITRDNLIIKMKESEFDAVININLKGSWLCSKAVAKVMMKKRYGRIVNIASVSGIAGQAGQTNYSASKAGIVGMTKALARELAMRNITVNAVAPGFIQTDMTANLPQDVVDGLITQIPLKRWGQPEDVAQAVAFLVSDHASYITGHVLSVNGGLVMD